LVDAGTPLPPQFAAITIDNAAQVSGLAEWREPTVTDLAWTPDDLLLAVSNQTGINLYDVNTRQIRRSLYPRAEGIVDIAFSPDGNWLVSGSRRGSMEEGYASSLELWLGPDWKPKGVLYGTASALSSMAFPSTGKTFGAAFVSPVTADNGVVFWNDVTWIITGALQTGTALDITFSPDGRLLAVSPNRYFIWVWDLKEGQWLYRLHTSFTGAVTRMVFSPDGITMASGHYDGAVRLWDMRTGELLLTFQTDEVIQSLAFSPDARLLATGGSYQNNLVRLWSAGSGQLLRSLEGHEHGVTSLSFSPLGQYLVSASHDGSIRLWGIRP
jgi:WD40 repeat protein